MALISPDPSTTEVPIQTDTESVCPECLKRIPAERIFRGQDVYLRKTCPEHGLFETVIWRGAPQYATWDKPKIPVYPENPFTPLDRGCPYDCGLCPEHRQQPCCVLVEVTQRCDLGCPLCFAEAGDNQTVDPSIMTIKNWFHKLMAAGGPFNIQLSGGEPCMRDDLAEIIALGRSLGFTFFQVNTNGLRIAKEPGYLERLKAAGLSTVYLQFDGTQGVIYKHLRGRNLLEQKIAAIERCAEVKVGVVLVPTVVPDVNSADIGNILQFALKYHPVVRGVHFQPISYFGRYPHPPQDCDRITLPEIIRLLEEQSGGLVRAQSFKPSSGENSRCSFHGNFVVMPDGSLKPLTHHEPKGCCSAPVKAEQGRKKAQEFVSRVWAAPKTEEPPRNNSLSLGEWDTFLTRARTHIIAISGMAFQDAWTMDLERLHECYILTVAPDGRLIPFCAYNLTNRDGKSLYREREG
jgi:7,8-dihydro-6-hydroxymethylpterin dimethyltransferase